MKMLKVILLGFIVVMFSGVSLAKGPAGGAAGSGGSSGAGTKTQDKDRIHTPGTGTAPPAVVPAADKTGTKTQDKDRIHTPGTGTAPPAVVPATN